MVSYSEVKAGWDRAAATDPNPAIHPAGRMGSEEYKKSGLEDMKMMIGQLGLPEYGFNFDTSIIDFGCGNGRMADALLWRFEKVFAVDFSYAMLQQLPKSKSLVPVLAVDNWFGLSEPADYAFSISVFIHNSYQSGVQMIKSISDNLKPGGLALLQIPIYDEATIGVHWTDVTTWTMDQLATACELCGFEMHDVRASPGKFSYENIGPNHHFLQVLKKKAHENG